MKYMKTYESLFKYVPTLEDLSRIRDRVIQEMRYEESRTGKIYFLKFSWSDDYYRWLDLYYSQKFEITPSVVENDDYWIQEHTIPVEEYNSALYKKLYEGIEEVFPEIENMYIL